MPSKSKPGATPESPEDLDGLGTIPTGEDTLPAGAALPDLDLSPAAEAPTGKPDEETAHDDGPPQDESSPKLPEEGPVAPNVEEPRIPEPSAPDAELPPTGETAKKGKKKAPGKKAAKDAEAPEDDAAGQAIDESLEPIQTPKAVKRPTAAGHKRIYDLKLNELDRGLSQEQPQEWNDIYASFRAKTVLTGMALGVDHAPMSMRDKDTGEEARHRMNCMVVIQYRVKVLIPESEMWFPGAERPDHVMQNMVGGEIDYVIMEVDREGECAVASRRMALAARRHYFTTAPKGHQEGELLSCRVLAVGPKRCMVECAGYDITLSQRDLTYVSVPDLREKYRPGQTLPCILKEYDSGAERLVISIKEVNPNPFDGACLRHPINSRRQATISGKYGGGVFCTLPDDTTVMCLYCAQHSDQDFQEGDNVIIAIKSYDYAKEQVFGRILAKWQ